MTVLERPWVVAGLGAGVTACFLVGTPLLAAGTSGQSCRSEFFDDLQRTCSEVRQLGLAVKGQSSSELAELHAYCSGLRALPPAFALLNEAARQATLGRLRLDLNLTETTVSRAPQHSKGLDQNLREERHLVERGSSPLDDVALSLATEQVCKAADANRWMPNTCALGSKAHRQRVGSAVSKDVGTWPATVLKQSSSLSEIQRAELTAGVVLLDAIAAEADIHALVRALRAVLKLPPRCADRDLSVNIDPLSRTLWLLERLAQDSAAIKHHGATYVSALLVGVGTSSDVASSDASQVQALAQAIVSLERQRIETPDRVPLLLKVFAQAYRVVNSPSSIDVSNWEGPARARWEGRLSDFQSLTAQAIFVYGGQEVPSVPLKLANCAAGLVAQRDDRLSSKVLSECAQPLGPWADKWLFDFNLGAADFSRSNPRLAGDAFLGYQFDAWGVAARGAISSFELTLDGRLSDTHSARGTLESWGVYPSDGAVRLDSRLIGELYVADTDNIDVAADFILDEETSTQLRGKLLVGARYEPSALFALGLWLGGGLSHEYHDGLRVPSDLSQAPLSHAEDFSGTAFTGRVRVHWEMVRGVFAIRLRADGDRFGVRRTRSEAVLAGSGAPTLVTEASTLRSVSTRLFVDLESLRVFEFLPTAWAGVDYVGIRTQQDAAHRSASVLGAGLRRTAF